MSDASRTSSKSPGYIFQPYIIWRLLFMQRTAMVFALAFANTGRSIAARIAMMAITTSNSIKVNAEGAGRLARDSVILFIEKFICGSHRFIDWAHQQFKH